MEERLLTLLKLALKYNATDIHFEYKDYEIKIDMRIDGKFHRVKSKIGDEKLIRYLGYLANLDTSKIYEPQTGTFELEVDEKLISLRFAVIQSVDYTNGVLRILNQTKNNELIKNENVKELLNLLQTKNLGLIIVAGPTGSGKTTLVYELLKNVRNKKIYTIENPIEVYNDNFIQLQINEAVDFDLREAVRQIIRHTPDILMISEVCTTEELKIALDVANSGCLVITTFTPSVEDALNKLIESGVKPEEIQNNLLYATNQKLIMENGNKNILFTETIKNERLV